MLLMSFPMVAQNSDNVLAQRYYQNQEYDKAATLYLKLYQNTGHKHQRDNYLRCLVQQKDYETGERFLKKELRGNKKDVYLNIDLGMMYSFMKRDNEASPLFETAIQQASTNKNTVTTAANMFIAYRRYDLAEKTYLAGAKQLNISFLLELGHLFYYQHDYIRMMTSYLHYLNENPKAMPTIQSRLQFIAANDIDGSVEGIIEQTTLAELQKEPGNAVYNDLLIWHYTQTEQYEVALRQLYANDKRTHNGAKDLIDFGKILHDNGQHDLALQAFKYVMDKGTNTDVYAEAYTDYLNVLYSKATAAFVPDTAELKELEQLLINALRMTRIAESFEIVYALVDIQAFYLGKYDEAIALITKHLAGGRFPREKEAAIKILLGDIYFLSGNRWDAILTYAQVEKSMRENVIGHEAKFRKAKLAYYTGAFRWAQAQLDVLKSSTSKLVANDAMELSLFISDNYDLDTTETVMQIFARADFYIFSKQYDKAFASMDTILRDFPAHSLIDDVLYRKAQVYEHTGNYNKAIELYHKIVTDFYYDILADNALFAYASLQEKTKHTDKAQEAYLQLIKDFQGSIFVSEARQRLRALRLDS